MKKFVLVLVAVLLCGLPALAQEYPKAELFMGYQWIRFGTALGGNPNINLNGGGGSIAYNFNPALGLKAEFTGAGFGDLSQSASTGLTTLTRSGNFFTYMFGPQVTIRKSSRVQPYGHLLFGGAFSNYYANLQTKGTVYTGPTYVDAGKHAFALAFGGGIDVKVHKNVAIRVAQVDYFMTRFSGRPVSTAGTGSIGAQEISNQSSFRYMAGINIHIGNTQ